MLQVDTKKNWKVELLRHEHRRIIVTVGASLLKQGVIEEQSSLACEKAGLPKLSVWTISL